MDKFLKRETKPGASGKKPTTPAVPELPSNVPWVEK